MANLNYKDYGLIVCVKNRKMIRFEPLADLAKFKIALNRNDAQLLPYWKLDKLIKWADSYKKQCIEERVRLQIRSAKDRKKVLHEVDVKNIKNDTT